MVVNLPQSLLFEEFQGLRPEPDGQQGQKADPENLDDNKKETLPSLRKFEPEAKDFPRCRKLHRVSFGHKKSFDLALGGNRTAGILGKRVGSKGRLGRMAAIVRPFAMPARKDKTDSMKGLAHLPCGLFGKGHPDPFADHFGIEIVFETK